MPGSQSANKRREALLIAAMLLLVAMVHLPWIHLHGPMEWEPPAETFGACVGIAFTEKHYGHYEPTAVISLAWDYFTTGKEYPATYRFHSLFGLLCQSAFLWLLLRRFRLPTTAVLFITLFCACVPWRIYAMMDPDLRRQIAAPLFFCMALWCATLNNLRRPQPWMILCALAGFIALGASPWGAALLLDIPVISWLHQRLSKEAFRWKPLLLPETIILLTTLFVFTHLR